MAITGIDGAGKGYLAERLRAMLERAGLGVAVINIDGWLNLPSVRFSNADAARNFYEHAIRFEELFEDLVLPLRAHRCADVEMNFTAETAQAYERRAWRFSDIDVILLEGIYLLKREFQQRYDFSMWVDCTFETALGRAIARGQEGLPPDQVTRAYRTIYFPAQRIHFETDRPMEAASIVFPNDPRL